ncbi:hypothetical protein [Streptomyces lydicus]
MPVTALRGLYGFQPYPQQESASAASPQDLDTAEEPRPDDGEIVWPMGHQ